MKKKKKLLTVEDLLNFAASTKLQRFSSQETGYQLAVHVPALFEVQDETDDSHRGMLKVKIKVFHEGKNLNGSYLSHDAAAEFAGTIPDRPVLAHIWQNEEGVYDFSAHDVELITNAEGETETVYIEQQIGSFSSDPAFWEYDETNDKTYVCSYAYIPEEYTKACDILRRKSGTKNSCELIIEEMSYNIEDNYLDLIHGYLQGTTFLGTDPDTGEEIGEGMEGSRADIMSFSVENNTCIKNEEGGNSKVEENELKVGFDDTDPTATGDPIPGATNSEDAGDPIPGAPDPEMIIPGATDSEDAGDPSEPNEGVPVTIQDDGIQKPAVETMTLTYELSHDDIRGQLYTQLHDRNVEDTGAWNWYWIEEVYDNYFVYEHEFEDEETHWVKYFKESYTKGDNSISIGNDSVEVFTEWLTAEERGALDLMRNTYQDLKDYKDNAEATALHAQKEAVLNSEDYAVMADDEAFVSLVENMDQYSLEEIQTMADVLFAKHIKAVGSFSRQSQEQSQPAAAIHFSVKENSSRNDSPYPGLFED